jgi:hypothetical protein
MVRVTARMERSDMPVARYFLYVGGVLLALLFISNAMLPSLPVAEKEAADLPVIRIHSDRKWPERIVFDTNLATITPAKTAAAEVAAPDVSANARPRDSFAQLQPADAKQLTLPDAKKPETRLPPKRKIAKRRVAPPTMLVAQQPQFGFFGNSWNSSW